VSLLIAAASVRAQEQNPPGQNQPVITSPFVDSDFDKNQPIKPGFALSVFVNTTEGPEEASGNFVVDGSGAIVMKLIGRIEVQDLRPAQAAAKIATEFKKFIKDPKVTVNIIAVPKAIVYLAGAVTKPGPVAINRGNTLAEVISLVGFAPEADLSKVRVIRRDGDKRSDKSYDLNRWLRPNGSDAPDESQNPELTERDIIIIPPKNSPPVGVISVEGDVQRTGVVPLRYGVGNRVREVLSASGGINPTATYSVVVRRMGQAEPITIDWQKAEAGDPQHDIELKPDDVVYVTRISDAQFINVNGGFARPGKQIIRGSKTLTEAIGDAGGLLLNAKQSEGKIFRTGILGDPGRTEVISFDYKKIREGKVPDVALMPGDTVDIPNGEPKERFNWLQWLPSLLTAFYFLRQ
jgi:polysaccharide export outer membrane protein